MDKVSKHIDQLISRYLSGDVSEIDMLELENWLTLSEANKKYFDQIKFIFEQATKTYPDVGFDADLAWVKIKGQMTFSPKIDIQNRKKQWGWLRIAASVAILVGMTTLIYLITRKSDMATPNIVAITSIDSTINQRLSDNTEVFLNKKSKITYNPDYGKKNREVTLVGEAYFNASHSDDKPLIVKAENTFIKDLGTSFNIKAYPDEEIIEVYVETGKVIFYTEVDLGLVLVQGDVGVYDKKSNSFSKRETLDKNILSYKTKSFIFINAKLSDVIRQLNNVYATPIILKNKELENCTITVTFENENIETIVGVITETLDFNLSKTSKGFIIDGTKCDNL